MPQDLAQRLRDTIEQGLPSLRAVPPESTAHAPLPGKWTPREELGHLIDSATNNHLRFVLSSIDGEFNGRGYAQDDWVRAHAYCAVPWDKLIDLWYQYNSLLAHLVENIPGKHMNNRCTVGSKDMTLGFVIADYIVHMQHHLDHILGR